MAGMAGNRFAITLVGNLAPFYNFIMFLAYFLRILFQKQVGRFISRQHGRKFPPPPTSGAGSIFSLFSNINCFALEKHLKKTNNAPPTFGAGLSFSLFYNGDFDLLWKSA